MKELKEAVRRQEKKENVPIKKWAGIIAFLAGVVGAVAGVIAIIPQGNPLDYSTVTESAAAIQPTICVYSEYSKLRVGAETNITVTLEENVESVSITAYRDSIKNGDTVQMTQKNATEWQSKVFFEETGTFEIIATAILEDGTLIDGSTEIEVIP